MGGSLDLTTYRNSELEKQREANLLQFIPQSGIRALDIGARDGHYSRILARRFDSVFALDVNEPSFSLEHVTNVKGDITSTEFDNDTFDFVLCTEVLEHIPNLSQACAEITRVANRYVLIGVPFKQDLRIGQTTCQACGRINPPWGHLNSFTEQTLKSLFPALTPVATSFVGSQRTSTSRLAASLMTLGKNPWGTYFQEEPCVHCRAKLSAPSQRQLQQRIASALAVRLNRLQQLFTPPFPVWIHMLLEKTPL